jgi:hypothetical protein
VPDKVGWKGYLAWNCSALLSSTSSSWASKTHKLREYIEERTVYFKDITELNSTQRKGKTRKKKKGGEKRENDLGTNKLTNEDQEKSKRLQLTTPSWKILDAFNRAKKAPLLLPFSPVLLRKEMDMVLESNGRGIK